MRILVLSHMYPEPGREHYGVFVHEAVLALRDRGHALTVVAPIPRTPPGLAGLNSRWRRLAAIPARRELDGITLHHPRYLLLPRRLAFASAARRMARAVLKLDLDRDFDLIHAHAAVPDGAAARRVAKALGRPYLVTSHGSDVLRSSGSPAVRAELAAGFAAAAAVLFPSERARQRAEERDLRSQRAEVLWNGFDSARFLSDLSPGPREPRLITVANLVASKRLDVLLRALAQVRDRGHALPLTVVGDGPERADLHALADELALAVTWIPSLDRDALAAALRSASIFALPAEGESFGIVYLEAMASGLAVIATAGEGIGDLIRDGENGFLTPPGDVAALSDRLAALAADPERCAAVGAAAVATATPLGWTRHAERLEEIYADVLGQGATR